MNKSLLRYRELGQCKVPLDLQSLRVRKFGPARQKFSDVVRLEPGIMVAFPNAKVVNAALRSLMSNSFQAINLGTQHV